MSLTVLFDLDDTLLSNNMSTFLPAYIHALNQKFALPSKDLLPHALLKASEAMVQNRSFDTTLERVFNDCFYPLINSSAESNRTKVIEFYRDNFPSLRALTAQVPGAPALLEECHARGYTIAIATNPLFPKLATYQRVTWAGVQPDDHLISVISTFENFHYSKPHIEFYMEMLCRLNWPHRAVMVGNDYHDDIQPAERIGMPSFLLSPKEDVSVILTHPLSSQGALAEVLPWLDTIDQSMTQLDYSDPDILLAALNATPAYLDTMVMEIPQEQWYQRNNPGEWTPIEILCHLRDVDIELNIPRVQQIIDNPGVFISSTQINLLAEQRNYLGQNYRFVLNDFLAARKALIELISDHCAQHWNVAASHSIYGPTKMSELVELMLAHDQTHTRQLSSAVEMVS